MTVENFNKVLRAFLARTPFEPFTVELENSNQFEIDHPNAVSYRAGVAVFTSPGGQFIYFDHNSVVHFVDGLSTKSSVEE
jgi:hypothetical protein